MRRVLKISLALVTVLIWSAAPALANNVWNGYHWAGDASDPHDGSISLDLVNDLANYTTEYGHVLFDWDGAPGPLALNSANGGTRPFACDNVATEAAGAEIAGKIHVCDGDYGRNGWLGLARIWLSADGHIDAAVALMNNSYLLEPGSTYEDPIAWRHVLCQEVGHTFGLGHVGGPKKQSCMNDRWGLTNEAFQSPDQHDYDTLIELYGGSSVGTGDDGGGGGKPCNPNRPNCPNGQNAHSAPRAGGGWIVTFTFPADR